MGTKRQHKGKDAPEGAVYEGERCAVSGFRGGKRPRPDLEELFDGNFLICDDGFLDELNNKEVGALGEAIAATYLKQLGMDVLEKNYRCPEGEADLIAYDDEADEVVLVEVKTRRFRSMEESLYPEEAVTPKKERRYRRIASYYVMEHYPVPCVRFDVVAVGLVSGCVASIVHLERAFDWDTDR